MYKIPFGKSGHILYMANSIGSYHIYKAIRVAALISFNNRTLFHVENLSMVTDIASDNILHERGSGHVFSGECIKEMNYRK